MSGFKKYQRVQIAELRPYDPEGRDKLGLDPDISVSPADRLAGSPKIGDMIARNPNNHLDRWLVAAQYFKDNFKAVTP